jgi:hypothetical protein
MRRWTNVRSAGRKVETMEPNALPLALLGVFGCGGTVVFWLAFTFGSCVLAKRADKAMGVDLGKE